MVTSFIIHKGTANGQLLLASRSMETDKAGRVMRRYLASSYTLRNSELLLMSDRSEMSFDSRYFGPIPKSQIEAVIKPVLTW